MQIPGIASGVKLKEITSSRLNFSSATTELVCGSMIDSTMVEKGLLRGCEGRDTYPSLSVPFLRTEVNLPEEMGGADLEQPSGESPSNALG